jgi:hypothetical protein
MLEGGLIRVGVADIGLDEAVSQISALADGRSHWLCSRPGSPSRARPTS